MENAWCGSVCIGVDSQKALPHQLSSQACVSSTEPTQASTPMGTFNNTTYRNLQHHDYSTYTFLDLNLDLTKFRMPQPSSGRESPRH